MLLGNEGVVVGCFGCRREYQRHAAGKNLRMLHELLPTVDDVMPGVQHLTVPQLMRHVPG